MKRFAIKFVIVVAALVAADCAIGFTLERMYFAQSRSDYAFTTKALDSQTADVVILGSSRAQHHYDPDVIADSLHGLVSEVYNAGRNGHFLVYQSAALELILDRYAPRIVVLDVTPYDLDENGDADFDRLASLLPYGSHKSYHDVLKKRSVFEPIKALSKIYRYNSTFLKLLHPANALYRDNGYEPLEGYLEGNARIKESFADKTPLSDRKIAELENIVALCRKNDIKLFLVTSPYFADYDATPTLKYIAELSKRENIPFYSWLNTPQFDSPDLYHTPDHLNAQGAELYSREVAHFLKTNISDADAI